MSTSASADKLFGIYLNDHLAGSTAGRDLIRRLAKAERDWAGGAALRRLADEVEQDQAVLAELMKTLGVPIRKYKLVGAWVGEKVGRIKLNGQLLRRSPLSRVIELEMMRLGVEGKAAGWRTLRVRAESDTRLDQARIDGLISRALRQSDELERLRARAAAEAFGGKVEPLEALHGPASTDSPPPFERKPTGGN